MKLISPTETLLYADKIEKWLYCGNWKQDRTIVITTENIYNVKKDKIKRCIPIAKLGGISKSLVGKMAELVLHVPSEYDYRYFSKQHRNEIVEIIKHRYAEKMDDNLTIFGINTCKLFHVSTTEKDMIKNISRIPSHGLAIKGEDLIQGRDAKKETVYDSSLTLRADEMDSDIRKKDDESYHTNATSTYSDEEEDTVDSLPGENGATDPSTRATMRVGGTMIFTRKHDEVEARL